jgi:hypothetical protein
VPTSPPTLTQFTRASAVVLESLSRAAKTTLPPVANAALMPAVFACVEAVAADNTPRATRLIGDLWKAVSRPGAFAAGEMWGEEPIYLDGEAVSRNEAASVLASDGVQPLGVALFLGTARTAHWWELPATFLYDPDQPRSSSGQWSSESGPLPKSVRERRKVLAEPAHPESWAARVAGAQTVGEARGMIAALDRGRRVSHPNGAVGEITKIRGKTAVRFPDQTVTLDQMGKDAQHLRPTTDEPHQTPNPPAHWQPGDQNKVPAGTPMGQIRAKTVGEARQRLGRLSDGTQVVTPDGRLGSVTTLERSDAPAGTRVPAISVAGRAPKPLASYTPDEVPHFRVISRDPYKMKLPTNSPARKSLGAATAGDALSKIEHLRIGDRVRDHASGRTGTRVQYPAGGGKGLRMMKAGILFDGDRKVTPLDGFTGKPAQHLEWLPPDISPPGLEVAPKPGLVSRIIGRIKKALDITPENTIGYVPPPPVKPIDMPRLAGVKQPPASAAITPQAVQKQLVPVPARTTDGPRAVRRAFDLYERLRTSDMPLEQVKTEIGGLDSLSVKDLAAVSEKLGYTPENSRKKTLARLKEHLLEHKTQQVNP